MTKILIVSNFVPEPDRASGDLRFFSILRILAAQAKVDFVLAAPSNWKGTAFAPTKYEALLEEVGVRLLRGDVLDYLKGDRYDVVLFEFYYPALAYTRLVRMMQPDARIMVDSVDVHYNRLAAKARLTGLYSDRKAAEETRVEELSAYIGADLVIAVSEDDRTILEQDVSGLSVAVWPNVHEIPEFHEPTQRDTDSIVFVGGFNHVPNVDAMLYFVREIMPLIRQRHAGSRLSIIGSNPTREIHDLAGDNVVVLGYVPDTAPFLRKATVSVAPLRYGGGMKGKVGEAMSFGVPVVTTQFGVEGFGLEPGRHVLVADTAEDFAIAVVRVLQDPVYAACLGRAGYEFIKDHYSIRAMERRLTETLSHVRMLKPARYPLIRRLGWHSLNFYQRHIGWRLQRNT